MPDLLSHWAAGRLVGGRGGTGFIFLLGALLPDLLTRPVYILWPGAYWFVKPVHTPVGIVLSCLAVSGLFVARQRKRVFLWLTAGAFLHLFLDLFQRHLVGGYALAFPFSWKSWEIGWIWPEQTLFLLPVWLMLVAGLAWRRSRASANEMRK